MITLVTITYNAASSGSLNAFLDCVAATPDHVRLLVIDNASSDDTLARLSKCCGAKVDVIANSVNVGFARGCNQAAAYCRDFRLNDIIFINNDVTFPADFPDMMVAARNEAKVDILSPLIVFSAARDRIWYAGGHISTVRGVTNRHDGFGKQPTFNQHIVETDIVTGCCVALDVAVFDRSGGFDERFFVYWEDVDWSLSAKARGLKLAVANHILLYHVVSASTGGATSEFTIRQYSKNHVLFMRKRFSYLHVAYGISYGALKGLFLMLIRKRTLRQYRLQLMSYRDGLRPFNIS